MGIPSPRTETRGRPDSNGNGWKSSVGTDTEDFFHYNPPVENLANDERWHRAILVGPIVTLLAPKDRDIADFTFGEAGHTDAFLDAGARRVVGLDRDRETLERYQRSGKYKDDPRLMLVHTPFSEWSEVAGTDRFHGILVDLGVSTRQLLEDDRGFSFSRSGPLDMRMDRTDGPTLAEKLETAEPEELEEALRDNADLPQARAIARAILEAYQVRGVRDTVGLASAVARFRGGGKSHPATAIFMALRMWVNDELGQTRRGLEAAYRSLHPGGRLAVLTFHSTEDRLVKRLFGKWAGRCVCDAAPCLCPRIERAELVLRKPAVPDDEELRRNPRARSAKLRCVEKKLEL